MNHASAMPPDPKYIDHKVTLTRNMDYTELSDIIIKGVSNVL
jgi:hypothetical protein